jgi:Calcineurin-like phosphoesterase
MLLRLIGDVHGDHHAINQILQSCHRYDLTIQIGDYGAGFGAEAYLPLVSPEKFRVLHGNHDNPHILSKYPHDLGRFGILEFGDKKIFYVAGAWSIDYHLRTPGYSWWSDEELSFSECEECLKLWEENCETIDYVISHDGPPNFTQHIKGEYPIETQTGRLLWEMYKIHQPSFWYIGHWHKSFTKVIGNTKFTCLNINEDIVLDC